MNVTFSIIGCHEITEDCSFLRSIHRGFFGNINNNRLYVSVSLPFNQNQYQYFNAPFGNFDSHPEYATGGDYIAATRSRIVVTVPSGNQAQVAIDVTDRKTFCIRNYDFAVIFNCADASRIANPCVVSSYTTLGQSKPL